MAQNHGFRLPNGQRPYDGDQPFIFISYSHRDNIRVLPIIGKLMEAGYRVWYDEGIDPGTEWDSFIAEHIEKCGYFIAFMSESYLASDNCKDELNYVRDLGKPRLLVYLSDVVLPAGMQMRLGRLQAIHQYTYADDGDFFLKLFSAEGLEICLEPRREQISAAQNVPEAVKAPSFEEDVKVYEVQRQQIVSDLTDAVHLLQSVEDCRRKLDEKREQVQTAKKRANVSAEPEKLEPDANLTRYDNAHAPVRRTVNVLRIFEIIGAVVLLLIGIPLLFVDVVYTIIMLDLLISGSYLTDVIYIILMMIIGLAASAGGLWLLFLGAEPFKWKQKRYEKRHAAKRKEAMQKDAALLDRYGRTREELIRFKENADAAYQQARMELSEMELALSKERIRYEHQLDILMQRYAIAEEFRNVHCLSYIAGCFADSKVDNFKEAFLLCGAYRTQLMQEQNED